MWRAKDLSGLLLLYSAKGSTEGMQKLVDLSKEQGKQNVAFLGLFLLGQLDECVDLLVSTGRTPEAAFFARTYVPSRVSEVRAECCAEIRVSLCKDLPFVQESTCLCNGLPICTEMCKNLFFGADTSPFVQSSTPLCKGLPLVQEFTGLCNNISVYAAMHKSKHLSFGAGVYWFVQQYVCLRSNAQEQASTLWCRNLAFCAGILVFTQQVAEADTTASQYAQQPVAFLKHAHHPSIIPQSSLNHPSIISQSSLNLSSCAATGGADLAKGAVQDQCQGSRVPGRPRPVLQPLP